MSINKMRGKTAVVLSTDCPCSLRILLGVCSTKDSPPILTRVWGMITDV